MPLITQVSTVLEVLFVHAAWDIFLHSRSMKDFKKFKVQDQLHSEQVNQVLYEQSRHKSLPSWVQMCARRCFFISIFGLLFSAEGFLLIGCRCFRSHRNEIITALNGSIPTRLYAQNDPHQDSRNLFS
jgi:hypothetical protein